MEAIRIRIEFDGNNSFVNCYNHFSTYKIGKVDKNELYDNIRNHYSNRDVLKLVEDLEKCSDIYGYIN